MTKPQIIALLGAKGGQGTTTVAALLALAAEEAGHRTTLTATDPAAATAVIGRPVPPLAEALAGTAEVTVVDLGALGTEALATLKALPEGTLTYLVVRGPCYLALQRACQYAPELAGVVLLTEPDRALTPRDVEEVLGVRVAAHLAIDPAVARAIDAGLLAAARGPVARARGHLARTVGYLRPRTEPVPPQRRPEFI